MPSGEMRRPRIDLAGVADQSVINDLSIPGDFGLIPYSSSASIPFFDAQKTEDQNSDYN